MDRRGKKNVLSTTLLSVVDGQACLTRFFDVSSQTSLESFSLMIVFSGVFNIFSLRLYDLCDIFQRIKKQLHHQGNFQQPDVYFL